MSFIFKYNYPQVARDAGFQLRSYKDGPLDWHLMGSVEIERVLRDQCLEQIDSILNHLSEVPLGTLLETNILDKAIAKYFILSQFSLQYLLFCRKFLEETVTDLRETHGTSQMEIATLKRSLSEANNEILQLHKKITQMEAIHEVIYPCHLCTKNFVSNDALNLHVSRKHNTLSASKQERRLETPVTSAKDRENDLTLINTIKLELEIKQLKERLNNAERKIKETDVTTTNKTLDSEKSLMCSIGIQSNLAEVKENDDKVDDKCSHNIVEYADQVSLFEEKLQDLNQWKEDQRQQNSVFLAEINSKLNNLSHAMQQQETQTTENLTMQASPSAEDLEALLSKKVESITTATALKLDDVVSKMQVDYKKKLEQLEIELNIAKQLNKSNIQAEEQKGYLQKKEKESLKNKMHDIETKVSSSKIHATDVVVKEAFPQTTSSEKSSPPSNHTYIKTTSEDNGQEKSAKIDNVEANDTTDLSDATYDDSDDDIQDEVPNDRNSTISAKVSKGKIPKESPHGNKSRTSTPKTVTRKGSRKLVNYRLSDLGLNMKTKSLNHSSMKQISHELSERRSKLKEKHPNFYATRNRIKKFVDKLCSSKMPENAQALLKATRMPKHAEKSVKQMQPLTCLPSSEDDEQYILGRHTKNNASTPNEDSKSIHDAEFKQRLESILASPIMKPDDQKPVPMPRKRVMFNQTEMHSNETLSLSDSESEHLPKQHQQKAHIHQPSKEVSFL